MKYKLYKYYSTYYIDNYAFVIIDEDSYGTVIYSNIEGFKIGRCGRWNTTTLEIINYSITINQSKKSRIRIYVNDLGEILIKKILNSGFCEINIIGKDIHKTLSAKYGINESFEKLTGRFDNWKEIKSLIIKPNKIV